MPISHKIPQNISPIFHKIHDYTLRKHASFKTATPNSSHKKPRDFATIFSISKKPRYIDPIWENS